MSQPQIPQDAPTPQTKCIACAYPLNRDRDILSVLAHLKDMMHHVGFQVDRVVVDHLKPTTRISITLDLSPPPQKRTRTHSTSETPPPAKRRTPAPTTAPAPSTTTPGCKLRAFSCCSTNSLCKANVCSHRDAHVEDSPAPPVPESSEQHHHHHHKHPHPHSHAHSRHPHPAAASLAARTHPPPVIPDPDITSVAVVTAPQDLPPRVPPPPPRFAFPSAAPVAQSRRVPRVVAVAPGVDPNPPVVSSGWTASTAPSAAAAAFHAQPPFAPPVSGPAQQVSDPQQQRSPLSKLTTSEARQILFRGETDPVKAEAGSFRDNGDLRPPPELVCRPCGLSFSTELELRKHQFMHHKDDKMGTRTEEGRFLCLMHSCAQSFVRRHVMERHFKTVHLMVREFPCTTCDKSFADSSTREAHRSAVHEKRKPWICDQCSSCFTQSSSLGKHRRRFHQEPVADGAGKQ